MTDYQIKKAGKELCISCKQSGMTPWHVSGLTKRVCSICGFKEEWIELLEEPIEMQKAIPKSILNDSLPIFYVGRLKTSDPAYLNKHYIANSIEVVQHWAVGVLKQSPNKNARVDIYECIERPVTSITNAPDPRQMTLSDLIEKAED